jgi:hypothetical protein
MTDPVKHCKLYSDEGCAHVDGFLCDYETCDMRIIYETAKNWAREIDREVLEILGLQEKILKSLSSGRENKNLK